MEGNVAAKFTLRAPSEEEDPEEDGTPLPSPAAAAVLATSPRLLLFPCRTPAVPGPVLAGPVRTKDEAAARPATVPEA